MSENNFIPQSIKTIIDEGENIHTDINSTLKTIISTKKKLENIQEEENPENRYNEISYIAKGNPFLSKDPEYREKLIKLYKSRKRGNQDDQDSDIAEVDGNIKNENKIETLDNFLKFPNKNLKQKNTSQNNFKFNEMNINNNFFPQKNNNNFFPKSNSNYNNNFKQKSNEMDEGDDEFYNKNNNKYNKFKYNKNQNQNNQSTGNYMSNNFNYKRKV